MKRFVDAAGWQSIGERSRVHVIGSKTRQFRIACVQVFAHKDGHLQHEGAELALMNTQESRRSVRREITTAVQIASGVGPPGSCRMLDVSETGARLQVGHGWSVPDVFLIILKPGLQRWCQVVWRAERQVGLMFTTPPRSLVSALAPTNAERFDVSPPDRA